MKKIIFFLVVILVLFSCTKITEVTVNDDNEDWVYHIGPGQGLLGNVDFYIIANTTQGVSILLINGPGNPIGYQMRKADIIYCQDSYIASGGHTFQSGTSIPFNQWVSVNLVVYKSTFAGWLWPIADLWDALYDLIVDTTYEIEVMIVYEPGKGFQDMFVKVDGKIIYIQVQKFNKPENHQKIIDLIGDSNANIQG